MGKGFYKRNWYLTFLLLILLVGIGNACLQPCTQERIRFAAVEGNKWLWIDWPKVTFSVGGGRCEVLEATVSSQYPPMMQPSVLGVSKVDNPRGRARVAGFTKLIVQGHGQGKIEVDLMDEVQLNVNVESR